MLNSSNNVVLPDTLVAQLIDNAALLSGFLQDDFNLIISQRQTFRQQLLSDRRIIRINPQFQSLENAFAIDGAHLAEIDRSSAYSVSCAVKVGPAYRTNDQSSCLTALPHVACLNSLSSGLMMMQEIMMAVSNVETTPDVYSLIDGSRISAIINIQSFYSGIARDMPRQIDNWRAQSQIEPNREPGRIISLFESRDWMSPFLTNPRIIGNLKLVTTNVLVNQYASQWIGRFDDKTFASLILEPGEAIAPFPIPIPNEPFHIHQSFPYSRNLDLINRQLTLTDNPNQIFHIYYRPDENHGVYKLELNRGLLAQREVIGRVFSWWKKEINTPDLIEPYSYYIADRFAKEAVSVAKKALMEIMKRQIDPNSIAWSFTQSYRTE